MELQSSFDECKREIDWQSQQVERAVSKRNGFLNSDLFENFKTVKNIPDRTFYQKTRE